MAEDHITLYGFTSGEEKKWFQLLQSVQGVGGRVAMAILGAMAPSDLQQAILAGDSKSLTRANGVGAKLASRLINELKDKVFTIALPPDDRPAARFNSEQNADNPKNTAQNVAAPAAAAPAPRQRGQNPPRRLVSPRKFGFCTG